VIDAIVNSILGRSGSLGIIQNDAVLKRMSGNIEQVPYAQATALEASFDVCPFTDELEQKLYTQDLGSTEKFLYRLRKWSKALPQELRQSPELPDPYPVSDNREWYIGGVHVACLYYFSVILATRRFLTNSLLDAIRDQSPSGETTPVRGQVGRSPEMAEVCLNAAKNLAEVAYNAMVAQQLMRNMCLIKSADQQLIYTGGEGADHL
jgi:hypothetical protein